MSKERLTAFTDGVVAIIVTIMVLELRPPHGASLRDLAPLWPVFLSYVLSFIYVAIYWNNHHHFFQLVRHVNGSLLWANLHLLFWLSLIPFTTAWMGENHFAPSPTAVYGLSLLMPAVAWSIMQMVIYRAQGQEGPLHQALGRDFKSKVSLVFYLVGAALAYIDVRLSGLLYVAVALMWLIPDRRVERKLKAEEH